MEAYYNDSDPTAAAWLRNLSKEGHITKGYIDDRSVVDVTSEDLSGYQRVHLFAGVAGWERALALAGWPEGAPVWTGSCPCQPFSLAGKRRGVEDERHLWPEMRRLITECRPPVVFGEQVASPAGRNWLATVRAEMEALGYAVGGADLCAAGVGSPHVRQRLFFGAIAGGETIAGIRNALSESESRPVPNAPSHRRETERKRAEAGYSHRIDDIRREQGTTKGFWAAAEWVVCRDNKARALEPGTCPVAYGAPARMGALRAYGNAIVPQVATTFIQSFMDVVIGRLAR